jgi:hypothetical protein
VFEPTCDATPYEPRSSSASTGARDVIWPPNGARPISAGPWFAYERLAPVAHERRVAPKP